MTYSKYRQPLIVMSTLYKLEPVLKAERYGQTQPHT